MKKKKLPYDILATCVLVIVGVGLFIYLNKPTNITDSIYKCNKDNDCVSVKSDCCGCTAGGSNTAINKDYLDYWNQKLSDECKEIGCPAVMSDHWTCFAKPKCVNGKCQLVK